MSYTYADLLRETEQKKIKAQRELKTALKGNAGFLVKAEMERNPGMVAWLWLAKEFCEKLAEHIDEWVDDGNGGFDNGNYEAREIGEIYMAYYDDDRSGLYELLPTEARLFDGW